MDVMKLEVWVGGGGQVKYWKSQKNSFLKDLFIVGFQPLGIKKINNKGFLKVENILVSVYEAKTQSTRISIQFIPNRHRGVAVQLQCTAPELKSDTLFLNFTPEQ